MRTYDKGFYEDEDYCQCGHTLGQHDHDLVCREHECTCTRFEETEADIDEYYDHKLHCEREGD